MRQFAVFSKQKKWSVQVRTHFLAASLRGKAWSILRKLFLKDFNDFNEFQKYYIGSHFGEAKFPKMYYTQLRTRKQKKDEDLITFSQKIEKLTRYDHNNKRV